MLYQSLAFVTSHYVFAFILALTSYAIGFRLTRRLTYDSLWEEASMCISLGLGAIGYLVFMFGLFGLLYRSVLAVTLIVCVALSYSGLFRIFAGILKQIKTAGFYLKLIVAGGCFAISLPIWRLPLYPPTAFDATMYFLTSAKVFATSHRLIPTTYLRFGVLTQLNEMLFTLALIFYDDIAAQLVQFLMLIVLLMALVGFGRRCFSRQAGWWSAAILLASPIVLWSGATAYLEIAIMLFSTMAVYAFWNWHQSQEDHWLLLSGAFCGFAASTKYPGLFVPLVLGLICTYVAIRQRRYVLPVLLSATTFLTAAPWYIRNFYYTHDPIFPFLPQVFGYSWFTPQDLEGLLADMHLHGVGRSISALLWIPWHLSFNQDVFLSENLHLSQIYFYLLPAVLIFVIKDVRVRHLMGGIAAFTLFWFFSAQILRYILPAIPLLSIAVAGSLDCLLGYIPGVRKLRSNFLVVLVVSLAFARGGWIYARDYRLTNGPVPKSQTERDDYLTRIFPSYPIYKTLNGSRGRNYTLYAVYDENMAYFVDGQYEGDWFGPATYSRIWDKLNDGQALYKELKSMGADYFLLDNRRNPITLPDDVFFRQHFLLVQSAGTTRLFELSAEAHVDTQPHIEEEHAQLLMNPGFENESDGWPSSWAHAGKPILDKSGTNSHTGSSAVQCIGSDNVFLQAVSIKSGTLYKLTMEGRTAKGQQQHARLQVNWSNRGGQFLSADVQVAVVQTKWNSYESVVSAPPQAANAVIYAACQDGESAWLDDFSFQEFTPLTTR